MELQIKKERNGAIELIRIISMFFIVMHHAVLHGAIDLFILPSLNFKVVLGIIAAFGKIGVILFMMITGYFMVDKKFSIKRYFHVWFPVMFYSISIFLIFLISNINALSIFSLDQILGAFLPNIYQEYWFVAGYLMILIVSPIINLIFKYFNYRKINFLWRFC